jgi:hypothetical protein
VRGGYLSSEREPDGGADSLASLATVPFSLPSSPMVMSFRACDLCGAASSQAVESDVFSGGDSAEDDERAKARGARAVLGTTGAAAARPAASELDAELGADDAARRSCQRALLRLLTTVDNAGPLDALGAEHPVLGAVHVRPLDTPRRTEHVRPLGTRAPYRARTPSLASSWAEVSSSGGWLQEHRGDLGRCLPSLLVVGSQRSGLGWPLMTSDDL